MRNPTLHGLLEAFTVAAGIRLDRAVASGDEVRFDVISSAETHRGRPALYCYRPLTGDYIGERLGLLTELPSFLPVVRTLAGVGGLDLYLRSMAGRDLVPEQPRERAVAVVLRFLSRVFCERTDFAVDELRFSAAYEELEQAIYEGRHVTEVVVAVLGIDLDPKTDELALGDGVSLQRAGALAAAPAELADAAQPPLLLVARVAHERDARPSVAFARARFQRVLTALRLFERGDFALSAVGYSRVDSGAWSPVAIGTGGRSRQLTLIPRAAEDELRAFCSLIGRRLPGSAHGHGLDSSGAGELSWALARFEMGCERATPYQALSDHLLALRALLEPEGPASGRLAQRLAMICAGPGDRAAAAARAARAIALERSVITGMVSNGSEGMELAVELADNLRAILRDVLCGHLDADLCTVADELLGQAVEELDAALV